MEQVIVMYITMFSVWQCKAKQIDCGTNDHRRKPAEYLICWGQNETWSVVKYAVDFCSQDRRIQTNSRKYHSHSNHHMI
jgi:hypothetical protein